MYKFDEQALRKGIQFGLGSKGIWTPELEDVMLNEITNEALRINDVVGQSEQLRAFKEFLQSEYHLPISNRMVDEFEQKQSS